MYKFLISDFQILIVLQIKKIGVQQHIREHSVRLILGRLQFLKVNVSTEPTDLSIGVLQSKLNLLINIIHKYTEYQPKNQLALTVEPI